MNYDVVDLVDVGHAPPTITDVGMEATNVLRGNVQSRRIQHRQWN